MNQALILVDIQNDFVSGGALPAPEGNAVVPAANQAMEAFDIIAATQDWHPPDHVSFAGRHEGRKPGDIITINGMQQVLWPDHCVQNTRGAEFVNGLEADKISKVFHKGVDRDIDSYSGFFDNEHRRATGLGEFLKQEGVEEIFVMGLATDYCVKFTALDAIRLGFAVKVIKEGVRGVEVNKGDCEKALKEMSDAGVMLISINKL